MRIKKIWLLTLVLIIGVTFAGCSLDENSDSTETKRVEEQQNIYIDSQPLPTFDWSLERHIFIELYKARNNAVVTYSYVRNWQGEVIFSCESIGFPMPANTQLTNSEKSLNDKYRDGTNTILPQPEPNGLFTSPTNVGTYVFCVNSDGSISPSYFEDSVEAHLSPLNKSQNGLSIDGSLKINIKE